MRNLAEIQVNPKLLAAALELADGVQILSGEFDIRTQKFAFILEGPDLPLRPEGTPIQIMPLDSISPYENQG